jgi:hypothetical protein
VRQRAAYASIFIGGLIVGVGIFVLGINALPTSAANPPEMRQQRPGAGAAAWRIGLSPSPRPSEKPAPVFVQADARPARRRNASTEQSPECAREQPRVF